jgi:hypothetical protein
MKKSNQYVIVRSVNSGVHAGYLVSREGDTVVLKDSRRLWRWVVAKMTGQLSSLSEVAVHGVSSTHELSRIAVSVPKITVFGVCEIIPASAEAQKSIEEA